MKTTTPLTDYYRKIIGYIETDTITGNKIGKDFYRRICCYYDKKTNMTSDFYHRPVGKGDLLSALIIAENNKNKK